jgi:hypothetical protein
MIDPSEYCRELETYLCRKNEGHLVRIVGPVFEQVCGWANRGVPLPVAFRGIDRYCERYYAKGVRRRPVRIEFCEVDILELFDDWRRAVGVTFENVDGHENARERETLPTHIDRVIARLAALESGEAHADALHESVSAALRELETIRSRARQARGDERGSLIARLEVIDRSLVDAAAGQMNSEQRAALEREAQVELAPFAARMSLESRSHAAQVAFERLVRDTFALPIVIFEG